MKNEVPCRFCQERNEICHSTCPRYLEYKSINDAERDKRFEQRKQRDLLYNPKIQKEMYKNG